MHPSVEPLARTLALNSRLFLNCLRDVDDALAMQKPRGHANHIAFVAVHLVDSRYYIARQVGSPLECPFKEILEGKADADAIESYPSLSAVKEAWSEVSQDLALRLSEVDAETLATSPEFEFPIEGGDTKLGMLAFLTQHDSYHLGQLSLLRRCFDLEPMEYGPV